MHLEAVELSPAATSISGSAPAHPAGSTLLGPGLHLLCQGDRLPGPPWPVIPALPGACQASPLAQLGGSPLSNRGGRKRPLPQPALLLLLLLLLLLTRILLVTSCTRAQFSSFLSAPVGWLTGRVQSATVSLWYEHLLAWGAGMLSEQGLWPGSLSIHSCVFTSGEISCCCSRDAPLPQTGVVPDRSGTGLWV